MGIEFLLRLGGGHDGRMTVPGVQHGNAAGKVDVAIALDIPQLGILGLRGKNRRGRGDPARYGGLATGEESGVGAILHGSELRFRRFRGFRWCFGFARRLRFRSGSLRLFGRGGFSGHHDLRGWTGV